MLGSDGVSDRATLETLLAIAVFAIPVLAFATVFLLLLRKRRKAPGIERAPAREAAEKAPSVSEHEIRAGIDTVSKRIDAAEKRGAKSELAPLYLELARGQQQLRNEEARMAALRSAAGYGAKHGPRSAHAAARLELGEAAYLAGDLTSACEQWQMARTAYLEDEQREMHARVEKRMRDNGCPTDWVLTDF